MKLRVTIIIGILLLIVGSGMMIAAASQENFNIKNVLFTNLEAEEKLYNADEIEGIYFDAEVDSLVVYKTAREDIRIIGKKGDNLEYNYRIDDNGILCIEQETKGVLGKFININIFGTIGIEEMKFIIELPEAFNKDLTIDINAGNLEIRNYDANKINIDINAGAAKLEKLNVDNLTANIDVGDIDINNCTFNTSSIKVEVGDIDISNCLFSNSIIEVEVGDIDANAEVTSSLDVSVEVGDINLNLIGTDDLYKINNDSNGTVIIKIDVEVGDFDYSFQN